MIDISVPAHKISMKHHRSDHVLHEFYLKKIGFDYFIYCLGKNGEPLSNQKIRIEIHHKDFPDISSKHDQTLTLDKTGRVKLGPL